MMVKANFSMSTSAIAKRIQRLPKMATELIETTAKGDADKLIKLFHDGIKKNQFGLAPLEPETISRKEAAGFDRPESPLYGLGDEFIQGTYCNMMVSVKDDTRRKYVVKPRDEYHYSQRDNKDGSTSIVRDKIKLRDLFIVHEYGTTITDGFGKGILIRLKPRPAFRYAYEKLMNKKRRADPAQKVRKAIMRFVKNNDDSAMKIIAKRAGVIE
jgi:hypothetical protein